MEYEEPVTEIEFILIAEAGRANGLGEARPPTPTPEETEGSGERVREEGCWRMANTNVLLRARRAH